MIIVLCDNKECNYYSTLNVKPYEGKGCCVNDQPDLNENVKSGYFFCHSHEIEAE